MGNAFSWCAEGNPFWLFRGCGPSLPGPAGPRVGSHNWAKSKKMNEENLTEISINKARKAEYAAGVRLAVPKFFINGREPLSRSLDAFSVMIEEELKK